MEAYAFETVNCSNKKCKNIQHKRKLPVVLQPPKYVLTAVPSNRLAIDIKTFTPKLHLTGATQ